MKKIGLLCGVTDAQSLHQVQIGIYICTRRHDGSRRHGIFRGGQNASAKRRRKQDTDYCFSYSRRRHEALRDFGFGGGDEREANPEVSARKNTVDDFDTAAVGLHEFVDYREANARAFEMA